MTHRSISTPNLKPLAELRGATLRHGTRTIWSNLSLRILPGEFIAVLGPNGAGKTTLLKALLGLIPIQTGTVELFGQAPHGPQDKIGYLPQQKPFDPDLNVRGRDVVQLGLTGPHYGWTTDRAGTDERVDKAIRRVGATKYADAPVGLLSGGQQQRLRIAQLLVGDPLLLLCDEPFISLDANGQHTVSDLLAERQRAGAAVIFVTHDLNAEILPLVSRVLYLVNDHWKIGLPKEILSAKTLSALYGSPVGVIRAGGRVMVLPHSEHEEHSIDIADAKQQESR